MAIPAAQRGRGRPRAGEEIDLDLLLRALFANPVEAALLGAPWHADAEDIRAHSEAVADVLIAGIALAAPLRSPTGGE